jgi:hypothetical protein
MQSVTDIINRSSPEFVNKITNCNDAAQLNTWLKSETNLDHKVIIEARIQNINYLIS